MKLSAASIRNQPTSLDDFNQKQVEINRKEAEDVKQCFTTQAHQTMMLCVIIMGIGIRLMSHDSVNWFVISTASLSTVLLCLATAHVGCHKYNTANRTTGFQIHLSRIIDYEENNTSESDIALELRRIDWEEAMFAWRIVQPVIYDYFYLERPIIGTCIKRFKWHVSNYYPFIPKDLKVHCNSIGQYPWYDSNELLGNPAFLSDMNKSRACSASFYPGTYLRKMLTKLHAMTLLFLGTFVVAIRQSCISTDNDTLFSVIVVVGAAFTVFSIMSMINTFLRCRILESGLLSIQTSAFVWRIVCICHLVAKLNTSKHNSSNSENDSINQVYNGYTCELSRLACEELHQKLHDIHQWLQRQECKIKEELKSQPKQRAFRFWM